MPRQTLSVLETEVQNGLGGILHPTWNNFVVAKGFPGLEVTKQTSTDAIARVLSAPGRTQGVFPSKLFDLLEEFYATPNGNWRGDGIALDSVRNFAGFSDIENKKLSLKSMIAITNKYAYILPSDLSQFASLRDSSSIRSLRCDSNGILPFQRSCVQTRRGGLLPAKNRLRKLNTSRWDLG